MEDALSEKIVDRGLDLIISGDARKIVEKWCMYDRWDDFDGYKKKGENEKLGHPNGEDIYFFSAAFKTALLCCLQIVQTELTKNKENENGN